MGVPYTPPIRTGRTGKKALHAMLFSVRAVHAMLFSVQAVCTARTYGCWYVRAPKTSVRTGRMYGPYVRVHMAHMYGYVVYRPLDILCTQCQTPPRIQKDMYFCLFVCLLSIFLSFVSVFLSLCLLNGVFKLLGTTYRA